MTGYSFCLVKRRTNRLNNERIAAIDKLRFIAICGVILIHTTTRVLERTSYNLDTYSFTLILNQIVRFSVPVFFLISGLVLELTHQDNLNFWKYLKRRFSKIFIPYIFWSLIYYYFVYTNNHNNLMIVLLTGNASYQLYFIPTLCIFYLLFPLLHRIYSFLSKPVVISLFLIFELELLYRDYFVRNLELIDPIRIAVLGLFFFIAGMIMSHHLESVIKFCKKWKAALSVVTLIYIYHLFRESLLQYRTTYNINAFYSSWRPSTFAYTFFSGATLLTILNNFNFTKLANLSFLVFFIHVIVLEFVWKYLDKYISPNFYFDLVFFIVVCGISFLCSYLIHKIPSVSKLTG